MPLETDVHVERVEFKRGPLWDFMCDGETRQVDLEGAIRSGKTTACLWKIIHSCVSHTGIHWLACRYSDAETRTKLKPRLAELCAQAGLAVVWNATEMAYDFPFQDGRRSRIYVFGLKTQDQLTRYAKLRGMTLGGIYVDQAEELPQDVYDELRGRLTQSGVGPAQLILSPNPPSEDHWIAREFPDDNRHRGNAYYRVSLYDNAHNLDADTIAGLEAAYPVGHAKHGPMLLGLRGLNIRGVPVYGPLDARQPESAVFRRAIHERPLELDEGLTLLESIDYGKHHPCVVWAQYTPWAELRVLGGVLGHHLYLKDFIQIVQQYRAKWFPKALETMTCCDPAGSHNNSQGLEENGVSVLRDAGIHASYKQDSNTPTIRLAMIERLASYMTRRSTQGEAFAVDSQRWVRISATAVVKHAFLSDGLEAGYVWDEHEISVGNKTMRRPKKDGWYEHGQNCLEYLEHNFGGVQQTDDYAARHAASVRNRGVGMRDIERIDALRSPSHRRAGRGGY